MTEAEILDRIMADLPGVSCEAGCTDCCTVALFSPEEWRRVPAEYKTPKIGLLRVPMRNPGNHRVIARLPVPAGKMMSLSARPRRAVTEVVAEGVMLTSFGLQGLRCVFEDQGKGCRIYEHRPFICRIMGAGGPQGALNCPRGLRPEYELPETVVMQRILLWSNLFPPDTAAGGAKGEKK